MGESDASRRFGALPRGVRRRVATSLRYLVAATPRRRVAGTPDATDFLETTK
jgi:hypothetical protein